MHTLKPPRLYPPGGPVVTGVTGEAVCIRQPPDLTKLQADLAAVRAAGISSVAVVLKHAAIFPDHEVAVGKLARAMGFTQVWLCCVCVGGGSAAQKPGWVAFPMLSRTSATNCQPPFLHTLRCRFLTRSCRW